MFGVILAASAGTLLYFWKDSFSSITKAAFRSFISVIIILPGFLLVGDLQTGRNLMIDMSLPFGTAIFTGIFLGGLLLKREEARVQVEKSLAVSEEKYHVLFESLPLGIIITDKKGHVMQTNALAADLPAIDPYSRETIDSGIRIVNSEREVILPSEYPEVLALNENRKISNQEMGIVYPDGKESWYNVTVAPIPLKDYGIGIVYNDITEPKITCR